MFPTWAWGLAHEECQIGNTRSGWRGITRALATQAPLLLADKPLAALDPRHQLIVPEAHAGAGATAVAILHDVTPAARFADRIVLLDQGKSKLPVRRRQP